MKTLFDKWDSACVMAGHESMLHLSWHDSAWIPLLNPGNVLDYFSDRTNPFYDRQCNNELIKMQRLGYEQLRYAINQ
jgi:mediator of RNA polymerase II transcription subunit 6